jgi:F-type H+-transporting ATPase subunit epsilon
MGLQLSVVTPSAEVLKSEVDEVIVPGLKGEIGMLPGHVPLVSALKPGVLVILQGGKKKFYAVSSGFTEIDADQVTILTDTCEPAEGIDGERAKRALVSAQTELEGLGPEDPGYGKTRRRVERALSRLDAVSRIDSGARG